MYALAFWVIIFTVIFALYIGSRPKDCQHEYETKDIAYLKVYKPEGQEQIVKFFVCKKCNNVKTIKEPLHG